MPEIRCENKLHGEVTKNSIGELRKFCNSKFCKVDSKEITEHVWNLGKVSEDGTIRPVATNRFKRPEVKGITK